MMHCDGGFYFWTLVSGPTLRRSQISRNRESQNWKLEKTKKNPTLTLPLEPRLICIGWLGLFLRDHVVSFSGFCLRFCPSNFSRWPFLLFQTAVSPFRGRTPTPQKTLAFYRKRNPTKTKGVCTSFRFMMERRLRKREWVAGCADSAAHTHIFGDHGRKNRERKAENKGEKNPFAICMHAQSTGGGSARRVWI